MPRAPVRSTIPTTNMSSTPLLLPSGPVEISASPTTTGARAQFVLGENATPPTRATDGSAGFDVSASEDTIVKPAGSLNDKGEVAYTTLVSTDLRWNAPNSLYMKIEGRSSIERKGIFVRAGVIDGDYRGEIKVMLHNSTSSDFIIKKGDRIAQFLVHLRTEVEFGVAGGIATTSRGDGGFGSTGI